ncbi:hypothetical protein B0J14DRAFT_270268 [Halenospora varia]|nr:hypothetical protein B0J14DRAFT_270268 [Halenospora varia]
MSRIECLEGLLGVLRPATAIFCPSSCSMARQAVDEYNAARRFSNCRINGGPDILSYGLFITLVQDKVSEEAIMLLGCTGPSSVDVKPASFHQILKYESPTTLGVVKIKCQCRPNI